jgi:hypothetical protein
VLVDFHCVEMHSFVSPQHSITDIKCRQSVFRICQVIAQNSDPGRKALIDDGILPVLLRLATNHIASNVINACKILKALAHTGTYRQELITAGVKDAMQQITRYAAFLSILPSCEHV